MEKDDEYAKKEVDYKNCEVSDIYTFFNGTTVSV